MVDVVTGCQPQTGTRLHVRVCCQYVGEINWSRSIIDMMHQQADFICNYIEKLHTIYLQLYKPML